MAGKKKKPKSDVNKWKEFPLHKFANKKGNDENLLSVGFTAKLSVASTAKLYVEFTSMC